MEIRQLLERLTPYYRWLYSQTGLNDKSLLLVGSIAVLVLLFLLHNIRKSRKRKIHILKKSDQSDIIGIKLAKRQENIHHGIQHKRTKISRSVIPDSEGSEDSENDPKNWTQSTKEWRKLRENIRHLQHDISKHERSEKHLKEQVVELQSKIEKLQAEIDKKSQAENNLQQQIEELTNTATTQSNIEHENANNELNMGPIEIETQEKESETVSAESQKADKVVKILNPEDIIPTETNIDQNNNTPLDIQELKAIADLVKRLQIRSQQRQGE